MFKNYEKHKLSNTAEYWDRNNYKKASVPRVKTGFTYLDEALGGGFRPGVHCLGAISTLGKSTFASQIIDQMASAGNHCLHFTLEVDRKVITAKSISRQMYIDNNLVRPDMMKTATDLMDEEVLDSFTDEEWDYVEEAKNKICEIGDRVWVVGHEDGCSSIYDIVDYVEKWIDEYEEKPIILIDYIQIVDIDDVKNFSEKVKVDKTMRALQKLAMDHQIPIITISSFNRDNYDHVVNPTAFKESGAIEFAAETLMGLQLSGTGEKGFDLKKGLANNPREIELYVLKTKNSRVPKHCLKFKFFPDYCYYQEVPYSKKEAEKANKSEKTSIKRKQDDFS